MEFIGQLSESKAAQQNILTDGTHTCRYADMPAAFDAFAAHFAATGISQADTVVLECENTVASALTLLFLLERGYSVLLVPRRAESAAMPRFARYRLLTTESGTLDPAQFLAISANDEWNGTSADEPVVYLRTSGSTGAPKMAVHPHARLLANGANCVERLGLSADDRIALPVPIGHMFGLGAAFLPAVSVMASVDLQKGANLLRFIQREKAFDPTVVFFTPVFIEMLLKGRRKRRAYRLSVSAGDRFRGDTFARYEDRFGRLVNLYGSTEMGAIAASSPADPFERRSTTAGKPMSGVQMRVADASNGLGMLWCNHPAGLTGYVDMDGRPTGQDLAAQDGWFCTSDLGCIHADGRLFVKGRASHSVNRNGLLVYFADVENAFETLDMVDTAVVVSKGESVRGQNLTAYCVLKAGKRMTNDELRSAAYDLLPRRAVPDDVTILRTLPLLPNGKVDRQALVAL